MDPKVPAAKIKDFRTSDGDARTHTGNGKMGTMVWTFTETPESHVWRTTGCGTRNRVLNKQNSPEHSVAHLTQFSVCRILGARGRKIRYRGSWVRYAAAKDRRGKGRGWDEAGSAGTYGRGPWGRRLASPHPRPCQFWVCWSFCPAVLPFSAFWCL